MKMKELLIVVITFLLLSHTDFVFAQKVTVNDVVYRLKENKGKLEAYIFTIPKKATEVSIVGKVEYKGKLVEVKGPFVGVTGVSVLEHYKSSAFHPESTPSLNTVVLDDQFTKVPESMFRGASQIKKVILPNSIVSIEERAFEECKSLESINIPQSLKNIERNAFFKCVSLKEIKGLRPDIAISSTAFFNSAFDLNKFNTSFYYYSYNYILNKIKLWQKKDEFETQTQYESRITKENQDAKVKEFQKESIREFVKMHQYRPLLSKYDADNQLYLITSAYGDKYVKVPIEEAPNFKNAFRFAIIEPSFVISGNDLALSDLRLQVNGKEYKAESNPLDYVAVESNIDMPGIELPTISSNSNTSPITKTVMVDNTIDYNIPLSNYNNKNTFAVIIGNEKYQRVINVPYANNDARIFGEYCKRTLGIPDKNVRLYENATYGSMIAAINDIQKISKAFKGNINVIFYYAGHGVPDEADGEPYLLPVDADGVNLKVCYPLNQLYMELEELKANHVTCFLDCCFSGAERGDGMLVAARGVAIKVKSGNPIGNTVVFTAATEKQTAFPYKEKGHGMFTYYLLKKLRDTKGDCTLGELSAYICDEVGKQSIITNGKEQTPVILTSSGIGNAWKEKKLK